LACLDLWSAIDNGVLTRRNLTPKMTMAHK
jgi:hypothetical protein